MCLGLLKAVTGSYVPRVVEGGDRGFRVGRFPRFEASNTLLESNSRRFFVNSCSEGAKLPDTKIRCVYIIYVRM